MMFFFSGLHLPSLGTLLPHLHVSQIGVTRGLFPIFLFLPHLGWGEKMGKCFPYQVLIFRNAPPDYFFYSLRVKKQICKQIYIDLCVEDYSDVIIAKPGNGRVSVHCWRYVSIIGYAILFVLHPAGLLEHSILCNYCINFKR